MATMVPDLWETIFFFPCLLQYIDNVQPSTSIWKFNNQIHAQLRPHILITRQNNVYLDTEPGLLAQAPWPPVAPTRSTTEVECLFFSADGGGSGGSESE